MRNSWLKTKRVPESSWMTGYLARYFESSLRRVTTPSCQSSRVLPSVAGTGRTKKARAPLDVFRPKKPDSSSTPPRSKTSRIGFQDWPASSARTTLPPPIGA